MITGKTTLARGESTLPTDGGKLEIYIPDPFVPRPLHRMDTVVVLSISIFFHLFRKGRMRLPNFIRNIALMAFAIPVICSGRAEPETASKPIDTSPFYNITIDADDLVRNFPPRIRSVRKQLVYAIAAPEQAVHAGKIGVSRWRAAVLPPKNPEHGLTVKVVPSFYKYEIPKKGSMNWHVNFAHTDLFAFYGTDLLAQDELQVAEHPVLASVREMLISKKLAATTVERDSPTPILVMGVQRRIHLLTGIDPTEKLPQRLYGKAFGQASDEAIRRAVQRVDPPTISNIIAMVAPRNGTGVYTQGQIRYSLLSAYTAFRAAKEKSGDQTAHIHTGFWGCGAFGGDRVVMTAVQLAAARLAGIDQLTFYAVDQTGAKECAAGATAYRKAWEAGSPEHFIREIEALKREWGRGDGN